MVTNDAHASGGFQWLLEAGGVSITPTEPTFSGDTNGDGQVDLTDLNNVRNNFGRQLNDNTRSNGDFTSLGDTVPYDVIVDLSDLNKVRNHFGETLPLPSSTPRPSGDADGDGDVDNNYLLAVRINFDELGITGGSLLGDTLPFDGRVDIQDLNNVYNALPVPEPSSLTLLAIALAGVVASRHRRR